MAQISTYTLDSVISGSDILLGSDADGSSVTRNYTIDAIKTYINNTASGNTNFYLSGISSNSTTGVITFTVTGGTNKTLTLGTAAFSASTAFAASTHTHALSDVVGSNTITATHLNVSGNGDDGQYLMSDGDGSFSWSTVSAENTNNYLSSISKSGNVLTFNLAGTGVTSPTYTFGSAAFASQADIIANVKSNLTIADLDLSSLGNLANLNTVSANELETDAVHELKIKNSNVTEPKLKISNAATSGHVLTSDGSDGFTWASNTASNFYVGSISNSGSVVTFNLTGGFSGTQPSFTFGDAAFLDVGTGASNVSAGNHNHEISSLTNAGALATRDTVTGTHVAAGSINYTKLGSGTAGLTAPSNGQVLTYDSTASNFKWATSPTGVTTIVGLTDVANSLGAAGTLMKVNSGGNAIEFATVGTIVTPASLTTNNSAAADKVLGLDNAGTGWTWTSRESTVADNAITLAKMAGIARGKLIIGDASGDPAYLAAGANGKLLVADANGDPSWTTVSGDATISAGAVTIANNAVTYAKQGPEFTEVQAIGNQSAASTAINWALYNIYTMTAAVTNIVFDVSNHQPGMVKTIIITGSGGSLALAASPFTVGSAAATVKKVGTGSYSDASGALNFIQVTCIATGSGTANQFYYSIAQAT